MLYQGRSVIGDPDSITVRPFAHKGVVAVDVALPVSEHLTVGQKLLQDVVAKDERQGAKRPIEPEIQDVPADRVAAMDPRGVQRDESVTVRPELLVAPVFQTAGRLDVVLGLCAQPHQDDAPCRDRAVGVEDCDLLGLTAEIAAV